MVPAPLSDFGMKTQPARPDDRECTVANDPKKEQLGQLLYSFLYPADG